MLRDKAPSKNEMRAAVSTLALDLRRQIESDFENGKTKGKRPAPPVLCPDCGAEPNQACTVAKISLGSFRDLNQPMCLLRYEAIVKAAMLETLKTIEPQISS